MDLGNVFRDNKRKDYWNRLKVLFEILEEECSQLILAKKDIL